MTLSIQEFRERTRPEKTALLLGAGASVPSGAPTGPDLAHRLWRRLAKTPPKSDDLVETCTILARRYSRLDVVQQIVDALKPLKPTGGLLGLPKFGWQTVFTTNFDRLIEAAYKEQNIPLVAIRSNFDFTIREQETGIRLFKIHGCISQDDVFGHKSSMTLTEHDYEQHSDYRQILFTKLSDALISGDVLVIGQSLSDPHLSSQIKEAIQIKQKFGAPGTVYVLVYDQDDFRAPVLEDRGARIVFGGIDEFVHEMSSIVETIDDVPESYDGVLPLNIISTVRDVDVERHGATNVTRVFNGAPATYADIASGITFERHSRAESIEALTGTKHSLAIVGAAGVGKTTFARQLGHELALRGFAVWEHRSDFPFQSKPWKDVERGLRDRGKTAFLILDECTYYLRQTNLLVDHLATLPEPHLRLILTANASQWAPRLKSNNIFRNGVTMSLSRLEDSELYSLLNLVAHNSHVANLVHDSFKTLHRDAQFETLRRKSSADMFVCLKNIFANESLDTILLREYNDLAPQFSDYYRYVAALEAIGARVHRQLLIRMRSIAPTMIGAALEGLTGIIDEYDIDPRQGVYGWRTRHLVIARKIAEYKFSSVPELVDLFDTVIDSLSPTIPIEMRTIRDLCDAEFGIGRIADKATRKRLYKRLIDIAPGERIPWHRLVRELLQERDVEEAEYVLRNAEHAAGRDAPIDRYRVRLLMVRAQHTRGIAGADRVALLRKAYELALNNIDRYTRDKYSYFTLCDVASRLVERGESRYLLEEAITRGRDASDTILDPEMVARIDEYARSYLR